MKAIAIIPARMNASRFPGKPLAKLHGMPMIGHCYLRTQMCEDLVDTYVATCDSEIFDYIESIEGKVIMTSKDHERASDRTAEAMLKIEKKNKEKVDVVVMVQGDEPMVTAKMISESIKPFKTDKSIKVANLVASMGSIEEFEDPNEIKVVIDKNNDALYFSRRAIPFMKENNVNIPMLKQVCIIPFRRDFLITFNNLKETSLEVAESVDMMRVLENGEKVRMIPTSGFSFSVDTEEDRLKVEKYLSRDPIMRIYNKTK